MDQAPRTSRIAGFLKLGAAGVFIWFFMFFLGPAIINAVPTWKYLGEEADRLNINTGSIFYTDVPISQEAEAHVRNTVRFLPGRH